MKNSGSNMAGKRLAISGPETSAPGESRSEDEHRTSTNSSRERDQEICGNAVTEHGNGRQKRDRRQGDWSYAGWHNGKRVRVAFEVGMLES